MPKHVARDRLVLINGTSISDHVSDVEMTDNADQIDLTAFGPNAYKQYGQGFKDAQVTLTIFSDFDAGSVHSILQPLYASGGTFALEVRPTSQARSASNPAALMTGILYGYTGIAGAVGVASAMTAVVQNAGTAGLTWATS
jgi:hypothetical protein